MPDFFCNCCEGRNGKLIYGGMTSVYSTNEWSVVSCENCSNIITMPVPDQKILEDIYSNTYFYSVHHLILGEKKMRARDLAKFIRKKMPVKGSKIFEAGCMYGYLLNELKDDYKVKGIEIGEEAVNICRSEGLDVEDISLENYLQKNSDKFDLIILSHVFEHLLSCDRILNSLKDRLNANGLIILCVPNSDSFSRKVFGKSWGWWQVPVHINHFSLKPLSALANRLNLTIENARFKGGDSLMILLNFINLFKFHGNKALGQFQKFVISIWTMIFRYWYYLGNEELTVVIRKKS